MPWIVSVLLSGLLQLVGSAVGRAVVALGFGYVEFLGISALIDGVKNQASSLISGFAASNLLAWAGFFRIDIHISIIISAIGVKVLLNSLGGTSVRRLVQK